VLELHGLSIHIRVQLYWINGHCSIIRNEKADSLAGLESKSDFYGSEPCLLVSKALITCKTEELLIPSHSSHWNLTSHARLSEHLHTMGLASDLICAACGIDEILVYRPWANMRRALCYAMFC
jgi:hypothetical protein